MAAEMTPAPAATFEIHRLDRSLSRRSARLHLDELPPSFFGDLGPLFLRTYHRSFDASPAGVAVAAVDSSGALLGFLVGTFEDGAHYRWVVRSFAWRLGPSAAVGLLRRPLKAWRFIRTRLRRYVRGATTLAGTAPPRPSDGVAVASLAHIAVAPAGRGHGVGTALVEAFVADARRSGAGRVQAKTLAGKIGAGGFYDSLGWRQTGGLRDVDGKPYDWFVLDLSCGTSASPA